jgi:cell wall assembly regulator SMI1
MSEEQAGAAVEQAWARVEAWLRRYGPRTFAALEPPATDVDILQMEEVLGGSLPAQLEVWWRTANGVSDLRPGPGGFLIPERWTPYSTRASLATWRARIAAQWSVWPEPEHVDYSAGLDRLRQLPAGTPTSMWLWLPEWLPLAGDGPHLFVDCRSGPLRGCVMVDDETEGQRGPLWPSVAAMFADVADRLEAAAAEELDDEPEIGRWRLPL